jgi:hypothetical protein
MSEVDRKKYVESAPLEDYLLEDPLIPNQNYFLLSYVLPGETNEIKYPIFKMRGAFKTMEQCQNRIKKIKNLDPQFHIFICEVGKFGSLLPDDELLKNEEIDIEYREKLLNNMVNDYRKMREEAAENFEVRKNKLLEAAKFDGTPEGQRILKEAGEKPEALKGVIENLQGVLDEMETKRKEVEESL